MSAGGRSARRSPSGAWRAALSAARPAGFFPLPGARTRGPRPVIVVHGYAMNRANFVPLAYRLARAGLGPIFGFEYWTLGRTPAAARQLGWFVDQVRAATGATEVDIVGHSMGGVVGRYYVTLAGGDGVVAQPRHARLAARRHRRVARSASATRRASSCSARSSSTRLAAAPPPRHDADHRDLVARRRARPGRPAARRSPAPRSIMYDDLGHVALLGSRRVAAAISDRLGDRLGDRRDAPGPADPLSGRTASPSSRARSSRRRARRPRRRRPAGSRS